MAGKLGNPEGHSALWGDLARCHADCGARGQDRILFGRIGPGYGAGFARFRRPDRAVLEIGILVACWTLCNSVATAMAIAAILAHLKERVDLFCGLRASGTLGFLCACVVSGWLSGRSRPTRSGWRRWTTCYFRSSACSGCRPSSPPTRSRALKSVELGWTLVPSRDKPGLVSYRWFSFADRWQESMSTHTTTFFNQLGVLPLPDGRPFDRLGCRSPDPPGDE